MADRHYKPSDNEGDKLGDPKRILALENSGLLDTLPEPQFDRVTRIASILLDAQVSLLSLVDVNRQFFKSACGLPDPWSETRETPLSHSFCQHVVVSGAPFIVDDARQNPIVKENLAITDLSVVGYLGVPVHDPSGQILGSLCAITSLPRTWSKGDVSTMLDLAAIVENELALRTQISLTDTLAREFHHRVKNVMAVGSALISLAGREANSIKELVEIAQGRFSALSEAHDTLISQSDDVDLAKVIERLIAPYCTADNSPDACGPSVLLRHNQVTPICFFVHELATNSAKYGAFNDGGNVKIRWMTNGSSVVTLAWTEQSGAIDRAQPSGFGSQLIKMAAIQLNGSANIKFEDGELTAKLEFPSPLY